MNEFIIFFKRFDGRVWANAQPRTFKAKTVRDAMKKFNELFGNDTVPPRMTRVAKTVAIGEVETKVRVAYVK